MDIFKHVKLFEPRIKGLNESCAVLAVLEEHLKGVKLWCEVVAVDLFMASVLMSEVATGPIAAYFFFVEGSAIFCPQLLVWAEEWISQFVTSMCKLTFTAVAAMVVLNPVLAELSLELSDWHVFIYHIVVLVTILVHWRGHKDCCL